MKNDIINYTNLIPVYFERDYNAAVNKLISHMKNKQYYLHDRQVIYRDVTIDVNYATKNLNQSYFKNCIFNNCNLESASFVNSKFIQCRFISCNLGFTNFRNSFFENTSFDHDTIITGTKFGSSKFNKCSFNGCMLNSAVFDEAIFHNCRFNDAFWYAISLDLCLFEDSTFNNIKFRNMNFEFCIFKNIHMINLKLPFPTIPYIYGGFQYLKTTNDNVFITSQQKKDTGISKEEYLLLLDELETYYAYSNNYFPLANVYIAKNNIMKCKSAIILGIEKALITNDFRLIENYARLISFNSLFTMSERYDLLNHLLAKIKDNNYSVDMIYRRNKCIFNFRTCLFNSLAGASLHLSIKTNIEDDEHKIAYVIGMLKRVTGYTNIPNNYNIEIRHNSPYEFFINIFTDYQSICYTLGLLIIVIKGSDKILTKVLKHIDSIQSITNQNLEKQVLKQQIEINKLDIMKKKQDLKQYTESAKKEYNNLKEKNINIEAASYIILSDEVDIIVKSSDVLL